MERKTHLPFFRFKFHNPQRFVVYLLIVVLIGIFMVDVGCGIAIHQLAERRAVLKKAYSTVNSIQFGLLSVNTWRDDLIRIASDRIADFAFTPPQEQALKIEISKALNSLITTADSIIQHNSTSIGGKIKKALINTVVDWDLLRRKTPELSSAILLELEKPENRAKLKGLVVEKINEFAAQTHENTRTDTTIVPRVLAAYQAETIDAFNIKITSQIDSLQRRTYHFAFLIVGSMILFLLIWFFEKSFPELRKPLFSLSVALALLMLVVSLISPIIEIDARIKNLDFWLLGVRLQFHDQVIFFQSKSIMEVVRILLATKKIDSVFVGALLLLFSIIFPIAKLISAEIYLLGTDAIKQNRAIGFFAFKSGKWSMADVTVVAIFMAYIGFKGILDNQLANLTFTNPMASSITTNLTSLQPGFILFLSFVLYGLVLSAILNRITARNGQKSGIKFKS